MSAQDSVATSSAGATAQCFVELNNTVSAAPGWSPCGVTNTTTPFVSCCQNSDFCLEDGLCRYTNSKVGGSGYYISGCTDQQYKDGSCPQLCNSLPVKDAVYVQQPSQLWKCCGANASGTPQCDQPTDENFDAPRPERLNVYYQAGVGTVTSSTQGDRGGQSQTQTPAPSSSPSQVTVTASASSPFATAPITSSKSSTISTGVAGAIAGGAAAVVLVISLILVFLLRRRRPRIAKEISMPIRASSTHDFRGMGRPETPVRAVTSCDSTERPESPFVHAITAPWPLGNHAGKEATVMSDLPRELHTEQAWEMPAEAITPKNAHS